MFRNREEFSCVVMERKNRFSELTILEIIIQLQDEYELEEKEVLQLIDPYLIARIESEAIHNKQIRSDLKPLF